MVLGGSCPATSVTDARQPPEPKSPTACGSALLRVWRERPVGRGKRKNHHADDGEIGAARFARRADAPESSATGIARNAMPARDDVEAELTLSAVGGAPLARRIVGHRLLPGRAVRRAQVLTNRAVDLFAAAPRKRPACPCTERSQPSPACESPLLGVGRSAFPPDNTTNGSGNQAEGFRSSSPPIELAKLANRISADGPVLRRAVGVRRG